MKRKITITRRGIKVVALLDTNGVSLVRAEVERVRLVMADRIALAVTDLPYIPVYRSEVKVR